MSENIDPKALSKIKKCLALGESPNPHEAAAAMRQAHALMRQHGVEAHDVAMSQIGEFGAPSRTMARDKPARWEVNLAALIATAFGCKVLISRLLTKSKGRGSICNEGSYVFVGLKDRAEVAAYTASVLTRKCKQARQKWISEELQGRWLDLPGGKKKTTDLGDAFAEGWVHSVSKAVHDFANPKEIDEAIDRFMATRATRPSDDDPVRDEKLNPKDQNLLLAGQAGYLAGRGETLYRAMRTGDAPLALETASGAQEHDKGQEDATAQADAPRMS